MPIQRIAHPGVDLESFAAKCGPLTVMALSSQSTPCRSNVSPQSIKTLLRPSSATGFGPEISLFFVHLRDLVEDGVFRHRRTLKGCGFYSKVVQTRRLGPLLFLVRREHCPEKSPFDASACSERGSGRIRTRLNDLPSSFRRLEGTFVRLCSVGYIG